MRHSKRSHGAAQAQRGLAERIKWVLSIGMAEMGDYVTVMVYLAMRARPDGHAWPSYRMIARDCPPLTEERVEWVISTLVETGLLHHHARADGSRRGWRMAYDAAVGRDRSHPLMSLMLAAHIDGRADLTLSEYETLTALVRMYDWTSGTVNASYSRACVVMPRLRLLTSQAWRMALWRAADRHPDLLVLVEAGRGRHHPPVYRLQLPGGVDPSGADHLPSHGVTVNDHLPSHGVTVNDHLPSRGVTVNDHLPSRGVTVNDHLPSRGVTVESSVPLTVKQLDSIDSIDRDLSISDPGDVPSELRALGVGDEPETMAERLWQRYCDRWDDAGTLHLDSPEWRPLLSEIIRWQRSHGRLVHPTRADQMMDAINGDRIRSPVGLLYAIWRDRLAQRSDLDEAYVPPAPDRIRY